MAYTIRNLCADALTEIGVLAAGETLGPEDADFLLGKLTRLLDRWNAERPAVYADAISSFTLTPSLQPHTIGPSGATFTVTQRPVEIVHANIVQTDIRVPLTIRDADWWLNLRAPTVTSTIPLDLWYNADWPNGSIYLWPVPSAAYILELLIRVILATPTLDTVYSYPPGYKDALILTLAEDAAPAFGRVASPQTILSASKARARIFQNNDTAPRLQSIDAGMPTGRGPRASFNYKTGTYTGR